MRIVWLSPLAWLGLAALVLPLLIHLLTRHQTRLVPFPTLRFLRATRLAALRRRALHDWPLLLVRMAIIAAGVAALAGPVLVSPARHEAWRWRFVRAFVLVPGPRAVPPDVERAIENQRSASFASAVFRPARLTADGIRDAAMWLDRQPPASREVVIAGDVREGTLTAADLSLVPPGAGVRFMPLETNASSEADLRAIQGDDRPLEWRARATFSLDVTRTASSSAPATAIPISVRASAEDQRFAEAALGAVLADGVELNRGPSRNVVVVFDGADVSDLTLTEPAAESWMRRALAGLPGLSGGQSGNALVVRVKRRAAGADVPRVLASVARAAFFDDLRDLEPNAMPLTTLLPWSRPPGGSETATPGDEGDRRWFWMAALLLLAVEAWLRRARNTRVDTAVEEERVA